MITAQQAEYLPKSMRELVELIGLEATLVLVDKWGGAYIDVPVHAKPNTAIGRLLGIDVLKKLVAVHGGTRMELPRCIAALNSIREASIIKDLQAGKSKKQLAMQYGYTVRGIRKLVRRVEARDGIASNQQELF